MERNILHHAPLAGKKFLIPATLVLGLALAIAQVTTEILSGVRQIMQPAKALVRGEQRGMARDILTMEKGNIFDVEFLVTDRDSGKISRITFSGDEKGELILRVNDRTLSRPRTNDAAVPIQLIETVDWVPDEKSIAFGSSKFDGSRGLIDIDTLALIARLMDKGGSTLTLPIYYRIEKKGYVKNIPKLESRGMEVITLSVQERKEKLEQSLAKVQ